MSECVVRMEMPENCAVCPFVTEYSRCVFLGMYAIDEDRRADNCPIICQLPEGHGRLMDADACASVLKKLENEAVRPTEKLCYGYSAKMFEEAYTIVPAEAERSET